MRQSIAIARRRFWSILGPRLLANVISGVIGFVMTLILFAIFGFAAGDAIGTGVSLVISLIVSAPFVYVPAGVVLGEVGAWEAIERSVRLVGRRWRLAIVITLFGVFSQFIVGFGVSIGADVVARVLAGAGLVDSVPIVLVVPIAAALVFALGTLTFLVEAIAAAPAVHAFAALTHYTHGLEHRAPAPGRGPPPVGPVGHPGPRDHGPAGPRLDGRRRALADGVGARRLVDPQLGEPVLVLDAQVVGELVEDRDPDLVREVVGVGEVLLERQPEQHDPRRDRDPVAAPLVERHALVQAVEGLVGLEAVLAQLLRAGLVVDDEGDLVERGAERLRDPGDRAVDEAVEALVPRRRAASGTSGIRGGASAWRPYPSRDVPRARGRRDRAGRRRRLRRPRRPIPPRSPRPSS